MAAKTDYDLYLLDGETSNPDDVKLGLVLVKPGTLRQRKARQEQNLSEDEREQLAEQRAEQAHEAATMKRLDLRYWSESKFDHGADTAAEETLIHRLFLRALQQPDVQPGESLRNLAKRTLIAYFDGTSWNQEVGNRVVIRKFPIIQYGQGGNVWVPAFNPATQTFTFEGFLIPNGGATDYFEKDWRPPSDCTDLQADQPIDITKLPNLPPRNKKVPGPQAA